jgi:hypothetical protein
MLLFALTAWSGGIVSACGVIDREIEFRQGTRRLLFMRKKRKKALFNS